MTTTPRRVLRARRGGPRAATAATAPPHPEMAVVPVSRKLPRRVINFGRDPWVAVNQVPMRQQGLSSRHDYYIRVYFLAMGDGNRLGHAEYGPGALRKALSRVNRETGEVTLPSPATVSRAIAEARDCGLLAPESGARCLVLPWRAVMGGMGSNSCKFHGINVKPSTPRP